MATTEKQKKTVVVLEIDPVLHRDFKLVCAYEDVLMKQKIAEIISAYTYSVLTVSESQDKTEDGKIFISVSKDE